MNYNKIDKYGYNDIINYLKSISDEKYKKFHSGIVKDTNSEILGVRLPELRKIAKEILKGDYEGFLENSGKTYYEEVMLRGLVTASVKGDFEDVKKRVDDFVPWIDNWAVNDTFCSTFKIIKNFYGEFFGHIETYLKSENPWAVRVGLVLMMNYYLTDEYIDRVLERAENIRSDEYYVQMGKAWLLATAAAKFRDKTMNFIRTAKFDDKTFNMTVQKCIDSYRISKEDKEELRRLKSAKRIKNRE